MNEEFTLTEWLQKAKEDPKQFAIPVVFILAIAFLDWKFLYAPKAKEILSQTKKNQKVVSEMKNIKDAANKLEDIKIDIEEKKKAWESTKALCYTELKRTDFLRRVRELANTAGINVKSINPSPDKTVKLGMLEAKNFSVNFNFIGDMTTLLTFMRLVELEPHICFMQIPPLQPNASGTFDTSLTVSTILIPDIIPTNLNSENNDDEEEE